MSTLCSAWIIFFLQGLFPFYFSWIFFFYCLFIMSSLSILFFHYYESRATMCESILEISSIFTFSLMKHVKHSFVGDSFETKKKKHFYLIWCWFIFFYLIDKGFCPVCQFVFCNKLDKLKLVSAIFWKLKIHQV